MSKLLPSAVPTAPKVQSMRSIPCFRPWNWGEGEMPSRTRTLSAEGGTLRLGRSAAKAVMAEVGANPTRGVQATSRFIQRNRVKFPYGLFNSSGVGSFQPGDRRNRRLSDSGTRPKMARGE